MDALDVIHTRRSIRKYASGTVSEAEVREMLSAAMTAPSAGNAQPWRFVVITEKTLLQRIPGIHPYAGMAPSAALAILVCGDTRAEKYPGFWVQDCSAATQNLLLAARALNIGTVWCGVHPVAEREKSFQELCGLPEHIRPLGLVVAGRPETAFTRRDGFDPEKVRKNVWSRP